MERIKGISLVLVISLLVLASPSISQRGASASQLIFFGPSQTIVMNGTGVLLNLNLTDIEPQAVGATAQATFENVVNNETVAIFNSSVFALPPSVPTIVNMSISGLTLCTNYSIAVEIFSTSGAVLAPVRQMYSFPCQAYSQAYSLAAPVTAVQLGDFEVANATFTNSLSIPLTGVVIGVYLNQIGQTVSVDTATVTIPPGETASAYVTANGISHGAYNVTLFAVDSSGTPISTANLTTLTFST
jgi:hypothetical protein